MKAFTTLMKIAIMAVSIALVVMLVTSVMPLVMGGVDLRDDESLQLNPNAAALDITGKYTVVSSIDQDISDLTVEAYLLSRDGTMKKELVSIGPVTIDKDHPEVPIVIDESIPVAELALFFVTDNMDKETPGLVLPVTLHIAGSYSNNLASVDMTVTYDTLLSDTGSFSIGNTKHTSGGEISKAELSLSGIDTESMLDGIIPAGGVEFTVSIGGKSLDLTVDESGGDIGLAIETGDLSSTSIMSVINDLMDAMTSGSEETIEFDIANESGTPQHYTFSPAQIYSDNPELAEAAEKYTAQLEGISESLDTFLKKYAEMVGGSS